MDLKIHKLTNKVNNKLKEQKKIYLILIIIVSISILLGIIYALILNKSDELLVTNSLNSFFYSIKTGNIDYKEALINSLSGNIIYSSLLFLFGISIIGSFLIIILLFFKAFIFGFSLASIIKTYHFKGILKALFYLFPHKFISILLTLFLGFYALYFSIKLFNYLFKKKEIDLRSSMKRYLRVYLSVLIINIILSFFEVFITPYLIKLVT